MTESMCFNERLIVSTFRQILNALDEIAQWNEKVDSVDDYYTTPDGMKTLAATSMLLEAIGEGLKRIDIRTQSQLLPLRPEIPWRDIIGMRNHIAHGYFDIDAELVLDAVKNDLPPLKEAVKALLHFCEQS